MELICDELHVSPMETNQQFSNPLLYWYNFLQVPTETIKRTFEATTQFARSAWIAEHIYSHHSAPLPALNVRQRNEPVATDTVYSDLVAILQNGYSGLVQYWKNV